MGEQTGKPQETLEHWRERLRLAGVFLRLLAERFVRDGGPQHVASLTYATLLSLVPLMTVTLAVFSAFPVADAMVVVIQKFLFQHFVPESGSAVQRYLEEFSANAGRLSGAGFGFLLVVALFMMSNIDRAINTIWHSRRKRGVLNMFLVYWAVLTVGPLMIGASIAVTSYLMSLPLLAETVQTYGLGRRLLGLTPVLVSSMAFTLLYALVPTRRVPLRFAAAGGLVAAVLFELAKRGFGFYLANFPTYEAIYGALATVPIFLVWIYLCWMVTLLGAEYAYCLSVFRDKAVAAGQQEHSLVSAYRILHRLWRAQQSGGSLSLRALSRGLDNMSEERAEDLLTRLEAARYVLATDRERWALARDLDEVSLLQLYRQGGFRLPAPEGLQLAPDEKRLGELLSAANAALDERLAVPLGDLYREREAAAERVTGFPPAR